jgi:aminomethyltransferase
MKQSPLHGEHEALGARFIEFAGWQMPVRYASEVAEHQAVRNRAGVFDLSHMGEIEVAGRHAAQALDHALVGAMSALRVGGARYTMICAPDGGVIDDLIVYRLADERYLVVANAANTATVAQGLTDRTATYDAQVTDRSADYALIAVQGPRTLDVLEGVVDVDLAPVKYYAWHEGKAAGVPALLARTGYTGEDGFELFVPADEAATVWQAVLNSGDDKGLQPCGLAARDTLRLEAGMPLYGNELSRDVTPYDAGLGRVVRLDKEGDFIGRQALAERATAPPERTLVGLSGTGRRAPRKGYSVYAGDRLVGAVTSGAPSPTLGHPIAMAYVAPDHAEPGTRLDVDIRGTREAVEVVPLPFYSRTR